jgi:hypothetical protein
MSIEVYDLDPALLLLALRASVRGRSEYGEQWFKDLQKSCSEGPMKNTLVAIEDHNNLAQIWRMTLLRRDMIITCFDAMGSIHIALSNGPNIKFTPAQARAALLDLIELPDDANVVDFMRTLRDQKSKQ